MRRQGVLRRHVRERGARVGAARTSDTGRFRSEKMVEYGQMNETHSAVGMAYMTAGSSRRIRVKRCRFEADASAGFKTPDQVRNSRDAQ